MFSKKIILLFCFLLLNNLFFSQPISILQVGWTSNNALINPGFEIEDDYETIFGAGNVTVAGNGGIQYSTPLATMQAYDVIFVGGFSVNFPQNFADDLILYMQGGGHVVLSTEGGNIDGGGGRLMSTVWNGFTGQAITETGKESAGTEYPPRFHNSNGPWALSANPVMNKSTETYSSFGNMSAENVVYQRFNNVPGCDNYEAVCATFPSKPALGQGTLYIQGDYHWPFGGTSFASSASARAHARAIANMHKALLDNDPVLLAQLNAWSMNVPGDNDILGNDTTICSNSFVPFTVSSPTYVTYSWEDTNGNVLSTNQSYTINNEGVYILRTTGTPPQCDGLDTLKVVIADIPQPNFDSDTVCFNNQTSFSDLSTTSSALNQWIWNIDGISINTQNPSHTFSVSGINPVSFKVIDVNGCTDSITKNILVSDLPTVNFTYQNACEGSFVNFINNTSTSGAPYNNDYTFAWDFGDGNTSTMPNPSHAYNLDGFYDINLIAINENSCTDTLVQSIEISPNPIADFNSDSVCLGENTTLIDLSSVSSGTIINWKWTIENTSYGSQNISHSFYNDGSFNVKLFIVSDKNCIDSITKSVIVHPLPIANFDASTDKIDVVNNKIEFLNNSQGANSYEWFFDDQFMSNDFNPSYSFNITEPCVNLTTTLVAETQYGCKDTTEKAAYVEANILAYSPNSFTPNQDGNNDFFTPIFTDISEEDYTLTIFNRWGEEIFKTNDIYKEGWDGTEKGVLSKEGVYIWKATVKNACDNKKKQLKGHFQLLK